MTDILGECPVSTSMKYDGLNEGVGGGRSCWMVPDTKCLSRRYGSQLKSCLECPFYKRVVYEEEEEITFKFYSEKKVTNMFG